MAKKHSILPDLPIHGIADRGKGVGRTAEGLTVFVDGAVPGDLVDVFIQKKKSGFAEGKVERIAVPSPDRVEPFCDHFSVCGGCKWQNLDYQAQLRHKQLVVEDALLRIGKVQVGEFLPILGAPETVYYRNKLEFGFSNRRWLLPGELNPTPDPSPNGRGVPPTVLYGSPPVGGGVASSSSFPFGCACSYTFNRRSMLLCMYT